MQSRCGAEEVDAVRRTSGNVSLDAVTLVVRPRAGSTSQAERWLATVTFIPSHGEP